MIMISNRSCLTWFTSYFQFSYLQLLYKSNINNENFCKLYPQITKITKICSCDKSVIWVRFKTAKHVNNTGKSYKNPCRIFKIFLHYSLFACFYVTAKLKSLIWPQNWPPWTRFTSPDFLGIHHENPHNVPV